MTASPIVVAIKQRLRAAGYTSISTPFKMAGVGFDFTEAMRGNGGRSLDLILLIDTSIGDFGGRDGARVRQRIESLSRALDVTGSRYVLTLILAGPALVESMESLSETCRVLQVDDVALNAQGQPVDDIADRQLDDRIRVLLPLALPASIADSQIGHGPAIDQLFRALPSDANAELVNAAIAASSAGELAVTAAVAEVIGSAFNGGVEGESS